jgi:hypothetical protein
LKWSQGEGAYSRRKQWRGRAGSHQVPLASGHPPPRGRPVGSPGRIVLWTGKSCQSTKPFAQMTGYCGSKFNFKFERTHSSHPKFGIRITRNLPKTRPRKVLKEAARLLAAELVSVPRLHLVDSNGLFSGDVKSAACMAYNRSRRLAPTRETEQQNDVIIIMFVVIVMSDTCVSSMGSCIAFISRHCRLDRRRRRHPPRHHLPRPPARR